MEMKIEFPGGVRVDACYQGFRIATDQPADAGGEGSAPAPFDHFLASLGTCAGVYALQFLRQRRLPTDGLELVLTARRDPGSRMYDEITLRLRLPAAFPEKYRDALLRAIDLCSVKKHLATPPAVRTVVTRGEVSLTGVSGPYHP